MRYAPVPLLTAGDMSTSLNSNGEDLNQVVNFAIQAVFSGAPSGSLKLQASNDNVPVGLQGQDPAINVVNWTDITSSSTTISAAGNFMWNMADCGYRWIRVVYTRTSGTGSLTVNYSGKGV